MCPIDYQYLKALVLKHKTALYEQRKKEKENIINGRNDLCSGPVEENNGKN